ncbi:MAG TPA: cysteine hydrolase [Candidatus Marinimicrobia bacterium]|nr:cysteine hydrolase [Candidatus Neomarinimicrobiota bacterium]
MVAIEKRPLFFDVDTQSDFIEKSGALYVPDAETLKPHFKQLIRYARINHIPIWGSVDAHCPEDAELNRNDGPFPDHCMQGSPGQQKIAETMPTNPTWIENRPYSQKQLTRILQNPDEIYFLKQSFDMFDNPNLEFMVKDFNPVVVFGVATDYCVRTAVTGFLKRKKTVYLVKDAVKAVNPEDGQTALQQMQTNGGILVTTDDIVNGCLE